MGLAKHIVTGQEFIVDGNFTADPFDGPWLSGTDGWTWNSGPSNVEFAGGGVSELVTNGDFAGGATGWTIKDFNGEFTNGGWTIGSGHATHANDEGFLYQDIGADGSSIYKVEFDITSTNSNPNGIDVSICTPVLPSDTGRIYIASANTDNGHVVLYVAATGSTFLMHAYSNFGDTTTIDNITVKRCVMAQTFSTGQIFIGAKAIVSARIGGTTGTVGIGIVSLEANGGGAEISNTFNAGDGDVTFTMDGTYYSYGGTGLIALVPSDDFDGTIDNVSVKIAFAESLGGTIVGSAEVATYKLKMKIGGDAGSAQIAIGEEFIQTYAGGAGNVSGTFDSNGNFGSGFNIQPTTDFNGTIDNVSLRKVIGSGFGPEMIANGKFNGPDSWTFNNGWIYSGVAAGGVLPAYQTSLLSAIGHIEQGLPFPRFIVGGQDNQGNYGLYKQGTDYGFHLFRSGVFHVGDHFLVTRISIPLAQPIGADMSITPVLRFDNETTESQGTTINDTNFTDSEQHIVLTGDHFADGGTKGTNNFYLELQFTGSALAVVSLPITITIENQVNGAQSQFVISSVFEGFMPSAMFGGASQYLFGLGIDPDVPISDNSDDLKTGGVIRPVSYTKFSGTAIDASPIAIITTPKDSNVYVVLANGKLVSYDDTLGNETEIGSVTGNAARGAWYYSNYIYIATPGDLSRYGPLDGSPQLTDSVWTGATLGSQDALTDTSYPLTLFNVGYLNHFGCVHVDGAAYFLDFLEGTGMVHRVQTEFGSAQGDTNSSVRPSAFEILDLPPDFILMTITSYGNDMVVAGTFTTDSLIHQGHAALFFFNPADVTPSYYRVVYLPDAICSVLKYANGILYGISGDLAGGYRLFRYVGGDSIETLKFVEDGVPPLQSASDFAGNRIVWGANTTIPVVSAGLMAYGSKSDLFPRGLHHIAVIKDLQVLD